MRSFVGVTRRVVPCLQFGVLRSCCGEATRGVFPPSSCCRDRSSDLRVARMLVTVFCRVADEGAHRLGGRGGPGPTGGHRARRPRAPSSLDGPSPPRPARLPLFRQRAPCGASLRPRCPAPPSPSPSATNTIHHICGFTMPITAQMTAAIRKTMPPAVVGSCCLRAWRSARSCSRFSRRACSRWPFSASFVSAAPTFSSRGARQVIPAPARAHFACASPRLLCR